MLTLSLKRKERRYEKLLAGRDIDLHISAQMEAWTK
jgi:hypothetical protein